MPSLLAPILALPHAAKVALATVGGVLGGGLVEWRVRRPKRRVVYEQALAHARALGKPLLVVGDPKGGMTHNDYGYGDFCIDITGCPGAPAGVKTAKVDLNVDSIPAGGNSHVVFVCYVIECVENIERAYAEILRVAGSRENIFLLALDPKESAAWLYPGCRWLVSQDNGEVTWERIPRRLMIERRIERRTDR
jgi:hypothetical protein